VPLPAGLSRLIAVGVGCDPKKVIAARGGAAMWVVNIHRTTCACHPPTDPPALMANTWLLWAISCAALHAALVLGLTEKEDWIPRGQLLSSCCSLLVVATHWLCTRVASKPNKAANMLAGAEPRRVMTVSVCMRLVAILAPVPLVAARVWVSGVSTSGAGCAFASCVVPQVVAATKAGLVNPAGPLALWSAVVSLASLVDVTHVVATSGWCSLIHACEPVCRLLYLGTHLHFCSHVVHLFWVLRAHVSAVDAFCVAIGVKGVVALVVAATFVWGKGVTRRYLL